MKLATITGTFLLEMTPTTELSDDQFAHMIKCTGIHFSKQTKYKQGTLKCLASEHETVAILVRHVMMHGRWVRKKGNVC